MDGCMGIGCELNEVQRHCGICSKTLSLSHTLSRFPKHQIKLAAHRVENLHEGVERFY